MSASLIYWGGVFGQMALNATEKAFNATDALGEKIADKIEGTSLEPTMVSVKLSA